MWNTVVPGWLRTIFVGLGYRTDIVVAFPVAICCSTCRLRTIFTGMPHVMAHTLTRTSCNHANTCPYLRPRVERQPTTHVPSGPGPIVKEHLAPSQCNMWTSECPAPTASGVSVESRVRLGAANTADTGLDYCSKEDVGGIIAQI